MTLDLHNIPRHLWAYTMITRKELLLLVPYTITHIYRLEAAGRFPARVQIGQRRVAWRLSEVLAWLENRPPVTTLPTDSDKEPSDK